ncbi:helicase [Amycolatopsis balhimycina DSM 5908]|uniref:Helicase n=1 Tax=Amycolatopsis balhimycina DSM 5908 TaxID=1081091 RepID=A0A428W220_AMYBA|nr:UvrD-helicase domain-containing protein [Amycolatopsis balhimycina]RSM37128.1 helicase [Amycolatopsis balhimycina DSM 5908]
MQELAAEQDHVNVLYARLDALREEAAAALARGHASDVWRAEVARLAAVEDGLCFGRLDLTGGRRVHIGRIGLFEDDRDPLLVDWRAPAARPFYTATAAEPGEVVRRRRITTRGRTVVAVDDELLDPDAPTDGLVGEAALLATVTAERTGRMRDIVTTLQAEQDRIIRDDARGVLVVQGGPGTGKTAVALHRVAYLLYTHEHLRTRGVLVIGPSRVFLDYIGQVLPGLGENRVVTATVPDLLPGVAVTREDTAAEAARKGRADMATRLAEAVRATVRVPEEPLGVEFEQQVLRLDPAVVRRAVRKARETGLPHNQARDVFHRAVVATLTGELVDRMEALAFTETGEALDGGSADGRLGDAELRALAAAGVVLDPDEDDGPRVLLDEVDRQALRTAVLGDTGVQDVLDELWPSLTPAEIVEGPWSAADIPLLDEVAALVGESVPVFGHVVVDEAQELSEMDWRMLARRCPSRSMTVVGDLAQTGSAAGATSWDRVPRPHRLAQLTVGYRTPAEIMEVAAELLARHHPELRPPTSVRASGKPPWRQAAADVPGALAELVGEHTGGRLAIIAPEAGELAAVLSLSVPPDLSAGVVLLTPAEAKGLEFDAVVIADPAAVLAAGPHGPNDLYVAMTRATQWLGVVHPGPVPPELRSLAQRRVSSRRS